MCAALLGSLRLLLLGILFSLLGSSLLSLLGLLRCLLVPPLLLGTLFSLGTVFRLLASPR